MSGRGLKALILGLSVAAAMAGGAYAVTCKDFRNCREAVIAWCAGQHPRADGDNDGIPCENVCKSRAEVVKIMDEIGCRR